MRLSGLLMVAVVLAGCGKKSTESTGAAGSGTATAEPPPKEPAPKEPPPKEPAKEPLVPTAPAGQPLGLLGAEATKPPAAPGGACQAACEHRATCGLGAATGCTDECAALVALGTL